MILEAEKRGDLRPGGLVVEATAGNTGIGLARRCRRARLPHLDPDSGNPEPGKKGHAAALRRRTDRSAGTALQQSEQLPACWQASGRPAPQERAERRAVADQWNNLDNAKAHYESTGPEIWEQTNGKVDGFICAVGSGGTLAGASRYLKEKNKAVTTACADPHGFAMYEYFRHGQAKSTPGDSITEGIGLGRVTPIIESAVVDDAFLVSDEDAVKVIYELLEHEGLCLGGSSGINVAGAVPVRQEARTGPHHRDHALRFRKPLPDQAVQIRRSCARKNCRCRNGWKNAATSSCRSRSCDSRFRYRLILRSGLLAASRRMNTRHMVRDARKGALLTMRRYRNI